MTAAHVLIVEARFYADLADEMASGAIAHLEQNQTTYDVERVPGALEIPIAISMAQLSDKYDGFIALGCVIRGETGHYDVVAGESARALMDLGTTRGIAIGNGILTVDTADQAWARARVNERNKGADAAAACLALIDASRRYQAMRSAGKI
jgi:6,7-dimethyl-8-ribityllumazine synthase